MTDAHGSVFVCGLDGFILLWIDRCSSPCCGKNTDPRLGIATGFSL